MATVRLRHRHVLVDEYQDVNRASVELVKALTGDGKNLWVVGDARQSIYRFRGASASNMAAFADDFPNCAFDQLAISYRSTQKIIDTFSGFAAGMSLPASLRTHSLKANRGEGTSLPEIRRYRFPEDEEGGIAARIRELEATDVPLCEQAVLCRTNSRLSEIARALEDRSIPVLHLGSLFEREEIRDLLSLLYLAADCFGAALVRLSAMPRYKMPIQDVKRLLDHLRGSDQPVLLRLEELKLTPHLSPVALRAINRLTADLQDLKISQNPWDFLRPFFSIAPILSAKCRGPQPSATVCAPSPSGSS